MLQNGLWRAQDGSKRAQKGFWRFWIGLGRGGSYLGRSWAGLGAFLAWVLRAGCAVLWRDGDKTPQDDLWKGQDGFTPYSGGRRVEPESFPPHSRGPKGGAKILPPILPWTQGWACADWEWVCLEGSSAFPHIPVATLRRPQ